MELSPEELDELAQNPVGFIEVFLGLHPWEKQCAIAESVRDNRRTLVPSCHAGGKTTIAAAIATWWFITRPNSVVLTTAPTARHVDLNLWGEVRAGIERSPFDLGGELLPKASRWEFGNDWKMIGFSTNAPEGFQGKHSAGGNLIIFDEAPGVDPKIWLALRGLMTSPRDRFLGIGNPTESSGPFYEACVRSTTNSVISISAFDVPNVVEGREVIPGLASSEWVLEMQDECGSEFESHPDYVARVLGRFPDADEHALIPLSWMDQAVERWAVYNEMGAWSRRETMLGVDVARGGDNKTVIAEARDGLGIRELTKSTARSLMETTGLVRSMIDRLSPSRIGVDADGVGGGVVDRLSEVAPSSPLVEMKGGLPSELDRTRFKNRRSEWYWTLRERLDPDGVAPLALPPDQSLRAQLTSIRWSLNSRGQIEIESKREMAKRGIKSPDEADAVVYALAIPSTPNEFDVVGHLAAMAKL